MDSEVSLQPVDKREALEILLRGVDRSELTGEVLLFTDAHSWRKHFKRFYSPPQYFGAVVILYAQPSAVLTFTESVLSLRIAPNPTFP